MSTESMQSLVDASTKKPYAQPMLRVYGGIQDLTASTTNMGFNSDTRGAFTDSRTH
jgi:hypothetical protein